MRRRRSRPPHQPPHWPPRHPPWVRRGCLFTGWRGGCWRWRVWPGSCGCGRWRRWWRWQGWVSGWCWLVGGYYPRRGGRGARCPASRRGEPASPASPARGLVAGGSGWAKSSPRGVLAVGRRGLRPAGPADPSVRHAVGPGWSRPGVLVDPPGHGGEPWGPVLAGGAVVSPVAKGGAREGASCPGRLVAPCRQRSGGAPVPAVRCPAWRGDGPTVATVKRGGAGRATEGWRRRVPTVLRRRPARAEARSVRLAVHHRPPRRRARRGA